MGARNPRKGVALALDTSNGEGVARGVAWAVAGEAHRSRHGKAAHLSGTFSVTISTDGQSSQPLLRLELGEVQISPARQQEPQQAAERCAHEGSDTSEQRVARD